MPEFGVYDPIDPATFAVNPPSSPSTSGLRFVEPTLKAAEPGKYSTPYYAAYTNSGDLAAATYASDAQKVRLIDPKTGNVLYEGTGPEAAKMATGYANALSEDKGRKAAWAIQVGNEGANDWVTTGYDRKDPKHSVLGTIADIGLPILGSILLPGVGGILGGALGAGLGAAGGSAVSSIAQGRGLSDTLTRAAISGLGAGIAGPAAGKFVSGLTPGASGGIGGAAGSAGSGAANFTAQELAGAVAPLTVQAAGNALPGAIGAGLGGLAGNVSSGLIGNSGADTLTPAAQPTEVAPLVVQASQNGLTPAQIAAMTGLSVAAVGGILASASGGSPVVTGATPSGVSGNVPFTATTPAAGGSVVPTTLTEAIQQGKVAEWAANNPLDAAKIGLSVGLAGASLLGGAKSGGGGNFAINPNAGKPESLNSIFTAQLPAANIPTRQPRQMTLTPEDYKTYASRPEQSFFVNVPQQPTPKGFAVGGMVSGEGHGREDRVNANLSDGEYVVDAETVALLGDGSNKAGADMLDKFRVNLRRHKGAQLAEGRFSAKAKSPDAYMGVR